MTVRIVEAIPLKQIKAMPINVSISSESQKMKMPALMLKKTPEYWST